MDKKQLMVIEKYTQPFVQLVFEKGEQDLVFEKLIQIKGIFEETGLANFLAHIGVEDEEKAKSLRLFQPSDSQLLDHLIEVVILNHREALFYDIVTICLDSTVEQRFCRHCYDGCWFGSCSRAKANPHYRKKIWDSSSLDPTKDRSGFNWWLCRDSQS